MSTAIAPHSDASARYNARFIVDVGQELHRPLNSLLVLAEQLEDNADGNLTERQVQYASAIRASGVDLLAVLDDITDLAQAEANTLALQPRGLSLIELSDAMTEQFAPVAAGQGMGFSVELDDTLPTVIHTDPRRLRQVLRNLLSNAFRFSASGQVLLRIEQRTDGWSSTHEGLGAAEHVLAFSVTDTGMGIEESRHTEMFEAFARGDALTPSQSGGTGLGLSVSRGLVDRLDGEITVESALGVGSTFTVFLPLRAAGQQAPVPDEMLRAVPTADPVGVCGSTRVLLVDNNARNSFAMTVVLERMGVEVIDASSGAAALEILAERTDVDLVLLDIVMPMMNGYETVAEIRKLPHCRDLPVIALTGNVLVGERERCLAAGASDFLAKPVDAAKLRIMLAGWSPGSEHVAGSSR